MRRPRLSLGAAGFRGNLDGNNRRWIGPRLGPQTCALESRYGHLACCRISGSHASERDRFPRAGGRKWFLIARFWPLRPGVHDGSGNAGTERAAARIASDLTSAR